jgi:hypothetical protein
MTNNETYGVHSLQRDVSYGLALAIVQIVSPCLTTETQLRATFAMAYEAILAGLEEYESNADRRDKRLYPSEN